MRTNILQNGAIALVAAIVLVVRADAGILDLTDGGANDSGFITGDVGGTALVELLTDDTKPAGSGIFDPFLRLQQSGGDNNLVNSNVEQAYNTDGRRDPGDPIDKTAPLDGDNSPFNHKLQISDLSVTMRNGVAYVGFELDANEPDGNGKELLSIDNIRIYTKHADATAAGSGAATTTNIDDGSLGTLRFALNNPNVTAEGGGEPENWIKFNSDHNYSTGSGQSDLVFWVPVAAFLAGGDLLATDYVYFYNLNGVHFASDATLAAESGYEEWRQVQGGTPVFFNNPVPDGGATALLLGLGLFGVGMLARSRFLAKA